MIDSTDLQFDARSVEFDPHSRSQAQNKARTFVLIMLLQSSQPLELYFGVLLKHFRMLNPMLMKRHLSNWLYLVLTLNVRV